MQNVVIDRPYVPVRPRSGWLWPKLLGYYVPRLLRKSYGVVRVEFEGVDRLQASLRAGHGILLASNHCRDEDPLVLGLLSRAVGRPFFIMASWHLFMQSRVKSFLLPRAGAFSIYREGIDRVALNTAVEILERASRPLVIFPEGHVSRTNERLNDLMEGTGLIARTAARRRAKLHPPGRVVVHPIAIRYHFQGDVQTVVTTVLDEVETRLTWRPRRHLPPLARIAKVGEALLMLKELEYLGCPQPGRLSERLSRLIDSVLYPLEDHWVAGRHDGSVNARVKRLRTALLPDLVKGDLAEPERTRRWHHLADAYLAQQLAHYPPGYLSETSPPEHLLETVERFEEDLTDKVRVHGRRSAAVTVGEAIDVPPDRESRGETDPLLGEIGRRLRLLLGLTGEEPEVKV
jgi:1-acyl-sn-glycerol-3-phosphate acyltransferase